MYLIPAEIHTKRIIRFTVTSQFTSADDILKDWCFISETASILLAERKALNKADQPKLRKNEMTGAEEIQHPHSNATADKKEDAAKFQVELWIDKAWNRPRRPMRSLSCSSEPLPCTYIGPMPGCDCETRPRYKNAASGLPVTSMARSGPVFKITEMPSDLTGKQVLKKLTKFYSVPSFCNQWVQCGRPQLCCPMKASQAAKKHLPTTCRRMNYMPNSSVVNTAPTAIYTGICNCSEVPAISLEAMNSSSHPHSNSTIDN